MRSVGELMNLSGRVALVTGGGGHIGAVLAEALAELGAAVCVLDVSEQGCRETARRLERYGLPGAERRETPVDL